MAILRNAQALSWELVPFESSIRAFLRKGEIIFCCSNFLFEQFNYGGDPKPMPPEVNP